MEQPFSSLNTIREEKFLPILSPTREMVRVKSKNLLPTYDLNSDFYLLEQEGEQSCYKIPREQEDL